MGIMAPETCSASNNTCIIPSAPDDGHNGAPKHVEQAITPV